MSDDIVTRLRDLAMKEESPWANIYDHVMREAADEIERLRAVVLDTREQLFAALGRTCRCVNTGAANES
jgi:hypothetical protein